MSSGSTLVDLVVGDHESIRAMLEQFHREHNSQRATSFHELRRFLLAHEVAEEVVVYPAYAQAASGPPEAPPRRIDEQRAISEMLARLERLGVEDWRFDSLFAELEACIASHSSQEEQQILPVLLEELSSQELLALGQRYCELRDADGRSAHDRVDVGMAMELERAHHAMGAVTKRGVAA